MNQVTIEPLFSGLLKRHDPLVANDGDRGLGTFSRALAGRSRAWRGHLLLQQVPYDNTATYMQYASSLGSSAMVGLPVTVQERDTMLTDLGELEGVTIMTQGAYSTVQVA